MSASARVRRAALVLAASLFLVACTAGSPTGNRSVEVPTVSTTTPACSLDDKLVPSCGPLVGVTTEKPTNAALAAAESKMQRPYDLVYRFHRVTDVVPTEEEVTLVKAGRLLHLSIGLRPTDTWADVAAGAFDKTLALQAKAVAALGKPIWITFDHEPDNPAKLQRGSGSDYVRAWRRVRDVYRTAGATNAVWVWVSIGTDAGIRRAATMWPGNDAVDWISWDVYNASGCRTGPFQPSRWQSFESSFDVFRTWLEAQGPRLGIDLTKPMMISEAGSVADPKNPARRAEWYAEIPAVLKQYPQVKAVTLWDRMGNGSCDYRFNADPLVRKQVDILLATAASR